MDAYPVMESVRSRARRSRTLNLVAMTMGILGDSGMTGPPRIHGSKKGQRSPAMTQRFNRKHFKSRIYRKNRKTT